MIDRIHVRSLSVNVTPVRGKALRNLQARVDVMDREVKHMQLAITHLKHAVRHPESPTAGLASAVMDSRNWMLSLVMSHAYVQYLLGENAYGTSAAPVMLSVLADRAVNAGAQYAKKDGATI